MADLLHSNISFSFIFSSLSSPLNHSPHRHFSFIRFSPLNLRVSHSSSLLAKLSSDSSQFDIISRTENSDGSVSFKFGDVTEISPTVDDENEVDLARDDDGSLDDQGDVIADVHSDGMEEEFVEERLNSEFDSQSSEGFVRDALKNCSTSAAEVENSSDSVEDGVVNNGLTSTTEVENSIDSVEDDAVKNDSTSIAKVETLSDSVGDDAVKSDSTSSDELSNNSSATAAELENLSASIEDALKSDLNANATVEVENLGGTAEVELKTDLTVTAEVENSSDSVEEELDVDSIPIAEVENSSDSVKEELDIDSISIAEVANSSDSVKEELDSDSISIAEVANSSDINTAKYEKQVADNVAPTCDSSVGVMVGKSDELREASEVMSDSDKREHDDELSNTGKARVDVMIEKAGELSEKSAQMSDDGAVESTMITETSHSVEEHVVEDFNNSVMSEQSEAEQILENEKEDIVGLVSKQLEAEPVLDQEDEDTTESMSKQLEAEPIIDEESSSVLLDGVVVLGSNKVALADHPSIAKFDEQLTHDTSDSARPGVEASGIASSKTTSDSLNMENMSSVASSSPLSLEVNDVSPPTVSHSRDDQHSCDISLEAWPVSEPLGLASTNISLDSLSKEESLAPALSISSAVASLSHSFEALTGGKDASFVYNNWFGVADGVGQWSFGGMDVGLYAHEFMQNCEQLLKSESAGLTNLKKLLQKSAAMTQSTGSARVLIAHVANQVLHVANIGDSGFLIIRDGTVFRKSSPMVHEFSFPYAIGLGYDSMEDVEEYHIELEEGDVIITATDGLFDNLYEQEIASIVSKSKEAGMHLQDLAELLASKAQEVGRSKSARSPFADAAQAAGHPEFIGGKFDHVTVIMSLVQR